MCKVKTMIYREKYDVQVGATVILEINACATLVAVCK